MGFSKKLGLQQKTLEIVVRKIMLSARIPLNASSITSGYIQGNGELGYSFIFQVS